MIKERHTNRKSKKGSKHYLEIRPATNAQWEKKINHVLKFSGVGFAIVLAILFAYNIRSSLKSSHSITRLDVEDVTELQNVLFGGMPWVVLCSDSMNAQNKDGTMNDAFLESSKLVSDTKFMGSFALVRSALLNCAAVLHSGKSIYERLALNQTRTPCMFLTMGGERAVQLDPSLLKAHLKKKKRKSEMSGVVPGRQLAMAILQRVRKRFRLIEVFNSNMLVTHCIERKYCALFFGKGRASKGLKELVSMEHIKRPLLRWAYLDVGKTGYSLNLYTEIIGDTSKPSKSELRLAVFRGKRFVAMQQTLELPSKKGFSKFLNDSTAAGTDESMTILKKIPKITKRTTRTESKSNYDRNFEEKNSGTAPNQVLPEETESAQLKLEKQRRIEMEEEAAYYSQDFGAQEDYFDDSDIEMDDEAYDEIDLN